ncbi:MAG: DUF4261 domain-containing protein [Paracoccaceae bacterium]
MDSPEDTPQAVVDSPQLLPQSAFVAIVMLSDVVELSGRALSDMLKSLPRSCSAELETVHPEGASARITLGDRQYSLMLVAKPVPVDSLRDAIHDRSDDSSTEAVSDHQAHLVVACLQPGEEMGERVLAAAGVQLLAAMAGEPLGALAVLWVESNQLADWTRFAKDARLLVSAFETDDTTVFPARYWVNTLLFADGKKTGGRSLGLTGFTGYELYLEPVKWPAEDVQARMVGTIEYLFEQGPVLQHGQTLGATEDERFQISLDDEGETLRLTLEGHFGAERTP